MPHWLDQPDPAIGQVWLEGASRRLAEYRTRKVRGIPAEDVVVPL